ncbi:MAG: bacillithiol system redox-active protein YtxJ [Vicinamibacterales bacterium]
MALTSTVRSFTPLRTLDEFDALIAASHTRPIVVFKHSPSCGTSAMAFDELSDLVEDGEGTAVHLVDVLAVRPLSQAIAARVGVRHESPQVIVLRNGVVAWHGSHYRVTADVVRRAFAAAA